MPDHPFEVGGKYRNRNDEYTVLATEGEKMRVRFSDGSEGTLSVPIQTRIWHNIEAELRPPEETVGGPVARLTTRPVLELVERVLNSIRPPYTEDIIDEVCLAIESNEAWLEEYRSLVEHFSSGGKNGRLTVNSSIGWYTKELTGLATLSFPHKARSGLISSYTRLKPVGGV